jgi:hypothetical protein
VPKYRAGGHGALAEHDLVDASRRHAERLQELLEKNLTWGDRRQLLPRHQWLLVIVDDFHVERVAVPPAKADPPP